MNPDMCAGAFPSGTNAVFLGHIGTHLTPQSPVRGSTPAWARGANHGCVGREPWFLVGQMNCSSSLIWGSGSSENGHERKHVHNFNLIPSTESVMSSGSTIEKAPDSLSPAISRLRISSRQNYSLEPPLVGACHCQGLSSIQIDFLASCRCRGPRNEMIFVRYYQETRPGRLPQNVVDQRNQEPARSMPNRHARLLNENARLSHKCGLVHRSFGNDTAIQFHCTRSLCVNFMINMFVPG